MLFKRFLIWSSGSPHIQCSRTIYAIFIKDIMRNNSVKLFSIWGRCFGGDVVLVENAIRNSLLKLF